MNFFADEALSLDRLRAALMRMEDTIIFGLIERAQFKHNPNVYRSGAFSFRRPQAQQSGLSSVSPSSSSSSVKQQAQTRTEHSTTSLATATVVATTSSPAVPSFLDYFLHETEKLHASVRRYTSPDENPFFDNLPEPVLEALDFPSVLKPNKINVNAQIKEMYIEQLVPALCQSGDDTNYGSSATLDVQCLQAVSRRIHYGKFIAEAKFSDPKHTDEYTRLIREGNADGLMALLTNKEVERKLLTRLHNKAKMYGQDVDNLASDSSHSKINPALVVELYEKWIIPLTKKVEVQYLLQRLDEDEPADLEDEEADESLALEAEDQVVAPTAVVPEISVVAAAKPSALGRVRAADQLRSKQRGSETRFYFLETPVSDVTTTTGNRPRATSDLQ